VAENVMAWRVGGLNIDGTRIPSNDGFEKAWDKPIRTNIANGSAAFDTNTSSARGTHQVDISANKPVGGRWPANVIFDEHAAVALDMQSGDNVSRFFYTAKASKSEREAGLDAPIGERANIHPTVKPLSLMRYLVRLVTPPGGKVLDPFMGSGSTGCAAVLEGFDFVGIDITPEYVAIAQKRIDHYAVTSPLMNL
jgi:site-specific DNA-methyltransferase (adenine-specific)